MTAPARLTVLFDNYPGLPGVMSLWGFSALIRMQGRTILFDTGSNGRVLLKNMTALGLLTEPIDLIFLSHPHWDHIGGLDSLLELHPDATVALHEGFSRHFMEDVRLFCQELVVVGADLRKLAPGVFSTEMFGGRPPEHALVLVAGDAARWSPAALIRA